MKTANRAPTGPVPEAPRAEVDRFRGQHLALGQRQLATEVGYAKVTVDNGESPLTWLARRRGRGSRSYVEPHQLQAGERLRADFTFANLMPRTTSNWSSPIAKTRAGGGGIAHVTDAMVAARQRVHHALDAVGPEFAGLLLDVCCFLKRLEDVERDRIWPARSAKVVLQLALDRLARHYGYAAQTRGQAHSPIRTWLAEGANFNVDGT
jgi:hypothetical protein